MTTHEISGADPRRCGACGATAAGRFCGECGAAIAGAGVARALRDEAAETMGSTLLFAPVYLSALPF